MDLLEIQMEVAMNMDVEDIEMSYPHLLESGYFWGELFKRDFPLHKFITNNFQHWYRHYNNLREISMELGDVKIQEEWLEFISETPALRDNTFELGIHLSLSDKVSFKDFITFTDDSFYNYLFNKGLGYINDIYDLKSQFHFFYENGIITREKNDSYYSSLVVEAIKQMDWLYRQLFVIFQTHEDRDIDLAVLNIYFYGKDNLYRAIYEYDEFTAPDWVFEALFADTRRTFGELDRIKSDLSK